MLTDIEIAQKAKMLPIIDVAKKLGVEEEDLELYGKFKAKISDSLEEKVKHNKSGKLVLVTAINPTPAGEGKPLPQWGWARRWQSWGKRLALPFVSRRWGRLWA